MGKYIFWTIVCIQPNEEITMLILVGSILTVIKLVEHPWLSGYISISNHMSTPVGNPLIISCSFNVYLDLTPACRIFKHNVNMYIDFLYFRCVFSHVLLFESL